jgi:sugar phosphate isomerase/epimerase
MKQRFAICNETFGNWPWERVCPFVKATGYDGVEIAPFTFGPSVKDVSPARRREIKQVAADNGLDIVGLHWLLVSPPGLHVHTKDKAVRQRRLIICAR